MRGILDLEETEVARLERQLADGPEDLAARPKLMPIFSPDGKTVAYQRSYPGVSEFDIFVVPVNGGNAQTLRLRPH